MNWETIIAFGDSITFGARSYLGYPEYAGHLLTQKLGKQWNVVNFATNGFTAIDLARAIDRNFYDLKSHQPSLCTIMIGTNDIKKGIPLDQYLVALEQVVVKVRLIAGSRHIVLFGIPVFPPGIMYPYEFSMNDRIGVFNKAIGQLAQAHGLRFVQLRHQTGDFADGVHLNEEGVQHFGTQLSEIVLKDRGL